MKIYIVLYDTPCDNWGIISVTTSEDDAIVNLNNSYANCIQTWSNGIMINETIYDCVCEFCKSKCSHTNNIGLSGSEDYYQLDVCDSCTEALTGDYFEPEQIDRMMRIKK